MRKPNFYTVSQKLELGTAGTSHNESKNLNGARSEAKGERINHLFIGLELGKGTEVGARIKNEDIKLEQGAGNRS